HSILFNLVLINPLNFTSPPHRGPAAACRSLPAPELDWSSHKNGFRGLRLPAAPGTAGPTIQCQLPALDQHSLVPHEIMFQEYSGRKILGESSNGSCASAL